MDIREKARELSKGTTFGDRVKLAHRLISDMEESLGIGGTEVESVSIEGDSNNNFFGNEAAYKFLGMYVAYLECAKEQLDKLMGEIPEVLRDYKAIDGSGSG